ncbi:hypothetical protein V8E36_005644 [Tilletia maclaganii]
MSDSQGTSGSQLESSTAGARGTSSSTAVLDHGQKLLHAIGAYTKAHVERTQAQASFKILENRLRANPGERASKAAQLNDLHLKSIAAEKQQAELAAGVGLRLVEIVGSAVREELPKATAELVRQTEERCQAEARREIEQIRQTYEEQLAKVRQEAVDAAREEVSRGIEAFERSRTAAASLMVADPQRTDGAAAPESSTSSSELEQQVSALRSAHNKLAESLSAVADSQARAVEASASARKDGRDTADGQGADIPNAELMKAILILNERVQAMETRHTAAASDPNPHTNAGGETSAPRSTTTTRDQGQGSSSNALHGLDADLSRETLANMTDVERDLMRMMIRITQMEYNFDWLSEQQAETWALVQLAHYSWGSERMAVREFVRRIYDVADGGGTASGSAHQRGPNGTGYKSDPSEMEEAE